MDCLADASSYLIPAFWAIWLALWLASAFNVKRTRWQEPLRVAFWNRAPVILGIALLFWPRLAPPILDVRLWPVGPWPPIVGTLLVLAGLLFSLWARWHLGRNWSGQVTVKEGHTLTRSGPYRCVRHPIYSGLLLALLGNALAIGTGRGFVAMALVLLGFVIKLSLEEARMRETFADYAEYSRHTARLIPGVY